MITTLDRYSVISGALLTSFFVLAVAKLIHSAVSRNSDRRRIQGEPACYWTALGYFAGVVYGTCVSDQEMYFHEAWAGGGGLGLLIGYGIGMIHGLVNLWFAELKSQQDSPSKGSAVAQATTQAADSRNPYQPPES